MLCLQDTNFCSFSPTLSSLPTKIRIRLFSHHSKYGMVRDEILTEINGLPSFEYGFLKGGFGLIEQATSLRIFRLLADTLFVFCGICFLKARRNLACEVFGFHLVHLLQRCQHRLIVLLMSDIRR